MQITSLLMFWRACMLNGEFYSCGVIEKFFKVEKRHRLCYQKESEAIIGNLFAFNV